MKKSIGQLKTTQSNSLVWFELKCILCYVYTRANYYGFKINSDLL